MKKKTKKFMNIGDLVRHYSCGGKLELGIIIDIGESECEVWYPQSNYKQWNLISDFEIMITWEDLTQKIQKDIFEPRYF